jgi:hypothetical protein
MKFTHVSRRNDVGKEKPDHFSPHHILSAKAEIPVASAVVEIVFAQHSIEALIFLDVRVVEVVDAVNGVVVEASA